MHRYGRYKVFVNISGEAQYEIQYTIFTSGNGRGNRHTDEQNCRKESFYHDACFHAFIAREERNITLGFAESRIPPNLVRKKLYFTVYSKKKKKKKNNGRQNKLDLRFLG